MIHHDSGKATGGDCTLCEAVCRWIDRRGMIICLIIGLVLRIVMLWSSADQLIQDRDAYLGIARGVAEGRGYCSPGSPAPTAFRPPVYPLQLAGLMVVAPAAVAVAMVNLFWSAVGIWATGRVGRTLELERYGNLAALLVAIDPLLLEYSTQPMTEVTCVGMVVLLLYWIVRRDCRESARQVVVGLLFGLLVLCRPTFWPLPCLLLMGSCVSRIAGWNQHRHATSLHGGVLRMTIGTMLIVGPWVVRNQIVMGSPILTTTHGGYTLLLANNPVFSAEVVDRGWGTDWGQESFDRWQAELQADIARQLGPNASELERDRWQSLQARQFITAEPGRFLRGIWYRIRSLWSPVPQGEASSKVKQWLVLAVGVYYGIILLAFAAGMIVVAARRRLDQWWPLYAVILTIQLVHLAYWTNARMRAPLVPVISLFAVAPLRRWSALHKNGV